MFDNPSLETPPKQVLWPRLVALGGAASLVVAAGWVMTLRDSARAQTFVVIFVSIVIQALPFLLLGVVLASLVRRYLGDGLVERIARYPAAVRYLAAGLTGMAIPQCECGSVPVARSLAERGLPIGAAVTHMLAAPILNPLVIASTWIAFRGSGLQIQMTALRAAFGLAIAIAAGMAIQRYGKSALVETGPSCDIADEHMAARGGIWLDIGNNLLGLAKFMVFGAAVAALIQTLVPASILLGMGANLATGTLVMMVLAVVLSLCSSSDAFVAASLRQFNPPSQLAFLVIGPMVDLKLIPLYSSVLSARAIRSLVAIVVVGTVVAAVTTHLMVAG